jgi:outer membrane protein
MKRLVSALIIAVTVAAGTAFAADSKIGYIDMQRAISSSEQGKDAKDQLAAKVKSYQEQINTRQEELKKLKDQLEKQGLVMDERARAAKEKDYQQKLKEFQRFTKDAEDDLQTKDRELTGKILEKMERVIREYAKDKGYSFIFVKNETMLYADSSADLTDAILKRVNK